MAGQHAVVIGGSMAGLTAARVLAEHFARVTVVERDTFPDRPEPRRGVPQGQQIHVLLMRGRTELEKLFPGLDAELAAAGAPELDWTADNLWYGPLGWAERFESKLLSRTCTRPLIEWHVQRCVAQLPAVSFCTGHDVTGVISTADGATVNGVRLRRRGQGPHDGTATEDVLPADLVVDASGRTSRAGDWLEGLGYGRPPETIINPYVGYAGRLYAPPPGHRADWKLMMINPRPPANKRSGIIYPIEGGRWIAGLAGAGRDYPPTDEAGWLEFARGLTSPLFYETIKDAEPLGSIHGYQRTENRFRHYERMPRWPEHFVSLGDAACAFNPVYGQGMTNSALSALVLDRCLREQPGFATGGRLDGLARRFQQRLARHNSTVWTIATGEDYRYPTTEGPKPGPGTRFAHRYLDEVMQLSRTDPEMLKLLIEVLHLVRPSSALMRPAIAARVLPGLLRPKAAPAESQPGPPKLAAGQFGSQR